MSDIAYLRRPKSYTGVGNEVSQYEYVAVPRKVWEEQKELIKANPQRKLGQERPNPKFLFCEEISEKEFKEAKGLKPQKKKETQAE